MQLFQKLSGVEKRELNNFLDSPFFNRRPELVRLWQFLPELDATAPDRTFIFAQLFPDQTYDDVALRHAYSQLLQKIEWFLAYRRFDQQEAVPELALLATYREKKLDKHFYHSVQTAETRINRMNLGIEHQHVRYRLEVEKYAFDENLRRGTAGNLQSLYDNFDHYLISAKMRQACLMLAHSAVVQVEYDYSFLPLLLNWLETTPKLLETPEIALYYFCYCALRDNQEADFQQLRTELERYRDQFDPTELTDVLLMAINFCIRQLNAGQRQYIREAFDLYRLGLARKLLTEGGVMSRFTYKNIVALGLALEEFAWTEQFIIDYQIVVESAYRESSYCYNLARMYFSRRDYARAMPLLARVDDSDFFLMLDARVMLLKMYYESGDWEPLQSLLVSVRTFLRRKKQIGYHRQHYLSLLKYTEQLLALPPGKTARRKALRSSIESDPAVLEKAWLLQWL
ncbi:MAG: hypothetical protein WCR52_08755 [Bacteroidota bacterium]